MSNRRRAGRTNDYRSGYLRSAAWFVRRRKWYTEETERNGRVVCAVTGLELRLSEVQLHHVDYRRVQNTANGWVANERHEDLVAMGKSAHEQLHQLLDSDLVLRNLMDRRTATNQAVRMLRHRLLGGVHRLLSEPLTDGKEVTQ